MVGIVVAIGAAKLEPSVGVNGGKCRTSARCAAAAAPASQLLGESAGGAAALVRWDRCPSPPRPSQLRCAFAGGSHLPAPKGDQEWGRGVGVQVAFSTGNQ